MSVFTKLFKFFTLPQLDADQVKAQQGRVYLVDVRQPDEFRKGHITGARLIPLDQLEQRLKGLPHDRPIVCVCRSGNRSRRAVSRLVSAGYNASNLRGGMIAWSRAGLPIKRGNA